LRGCRIEFLPVKGCDVENEIISVLEGRIEALLESYASMKNENIRLNEEISKLRSDREAVKTRVDRLLKKLENL
jgi:cell division protein ZapB